MASVKSGFWENAAGAVATYSFSNPRSPNRYHLMRMFRKRNMKAYSEILKTLLDDSTPASTASVTISQVDAVATPNSNSQGGVRGVTANQIVDGLLNNQYNTATPNTARAVAASDVTAIQAEIYGGDRAIRAPTNGSSTITYPSDASGNGGGGKGETK